MTREEGAHRPRCLLMDGSGEGVLLLRGGFLLRLRWLFLDAQQLGRLGAEAPMVLVPGGVSVHPQGGLTEPPPRLLLVAQLPVCHRGEPPDELAGRTQLAPAGG